VTAARLHDDEFLTSPELVRAMIAARFPQWSDLPVTRIGLSGTMNALYRLGEDLMVRLPRRDNAIEQLHFERDWLPRLSPRLPVRVPEQLALSEPVAGFPFPWAVYRWIEGDHPEPGRGDPDALAGDLAGFVSAIQTFDPTNARTGYRTGPLHERDDYVREWTAKAAGLIDTAAVLRIWDEALAAPPWRRPPVWAHSDLLPGNVLVHADRLVAVLDFGAAGVGDPACDAAAAWNLLPAGSRRRFWSAAGFDDETLVRARGWAMTGIGVVTYYRETNPPFAETALRTLNDVIAERAGI
jgi:aminoglycoside phosphotransferase (APT) family kinase protein